MNPAEARHLGANLLHTYTEIADTQDVDAAVALLGDAEVRFPSGGFDRPEDARPFFERIWSARTTHRHDVTNLVVQPEGHDWHARAHYVRWMYEDEPAVHTLGRYDLLLATTRDTLAVRRFTVAREWSRA
ncbi:nuclear transport factor 2 family protein [Aeromicrobium sp. CF4.19]|uniref:nuclear transport factor 2 family protein n=1 Tax=Aeromicrobium sp. CF4.19 TaxID=3373082 RepID=UPI003EE7A880